MQIFFGGNENILEENANFYGGKCKYFGENANIFGKMQIFSKKTLFMSYLTTV